MAYKKDYWERIRETIIPRLGYVVQFVEDVTGRPFYVESEIHNNQFVGRVPVDVETFEKRLDEMGFERNPLASWKSLASTGEHEEGSFRLVGVGGDESMQLHVILYDGNKIDNPTTDVTYVYAHIELRWDVHPIAHYRGKRADAQKGVKEMKRLLDERGITYEPVRP
jgi:hypothetical protein